MANARNGGIMPIEGPPGTKIQFNLTSVASDMCDASCTATSLQMSDNWDYRTLSARYCCPTQAPKYFSMNSNVALMVMYTTSYQLDMGFSFRYVVDTPTVTPTSAPVTTAPPSCPSGQLWYPRTSRCITWVLSPLDATDQWQNLNLALMANARNGGIMPIVGPAGTKIQFNLTSVSSDMCDASCTATSLQMSDNWDYTTLSARYCCPTDAPKYFSMNSNVALMVMYTTSYQLDMGFSYRYVGTPSG